VIGTVPLAWLVAQHPKKTGWPPGFAATVLSGFFMPALAFWLFRFCFFGFYARRRGPAWFSHAHAVEWIAPLQIAACLYFITCPTLFAQQGDPHARL
jgi:hypothetical protein